MADIPEIPGYQILTELGEGGVATVYLGIQERLHRKVAVKILDPLLLKDKATAVRFEKEARIAANLSHSNIVQIYDTGKVGYYHYIVMEYLEESLKERMIRNHRGRMHPEMALDIAEDIMKALDYAHFRGIYHRDIKPENIMFRNDGTTVLVDFGIARVYDANDQLTKSGMIIGTVDYMSPEQCKSEKVDGRTDIYSLGVVLFEMFTGDTPYQGDSRLSVALQHVDKPVPRLPHRWNRYQPLIDNMMAKRAEDRISSCPEFIQLLDRVLTGAGELKQAGGEESRSYLDDILPVRNDDESFQSPTETLSVDLVLGKEDRAGVPTDGYWVGIKKGLDTVSRFIRGKLSSTAKEK